MAQIKAILPYYNLTYTLATMPEHTAERSLHSPPHSSLAQMISEKTPLYHANGMATQDASNIQAAAYSNTESNFGTPIEENNSLLKPDCAELSLCEQQHRLRLRVAKDPKSENILLRIGKYYEDKPDFNTFDGIDDILAVSWIDTEHSAYACNENTGETFLKLGNIFLDKRTFHQYNLWIVSRYNAGFSCSDDSDSGSDAGVFRDNDPAKTWGVSFVLKAIRKEMKKISIEPHPACKLRLVFPSGNHPVEITKKSRKNNMGNDNNSKITANHGRHHAAAKEKGHTHNNHTATNKKNGKKIESHWQNNLHAFDNALKQERKRSRSEDKTSEESTLPSSESALLAQPKVKRNKTARDSTADTVAVCTNEEKPPAITELQQSPPVTKEETPNKDDQSARPADPPETLINVASNKSKKNHRPRRAEPTAIIAFTSEPVKRQSKRKKIKRPNITVHDVDPNRSLCWNMENFILHKFFNDNKCKLDGKEMLQKFSKKAKRRRDRICHLWEKYGKKFFDIPYPASETGTYPACYVDITSEMLQNDLDIKSDYETIVKILNGIEARFDTSVKRNMIEGQSAESRFTFNHIASFG